MDERRKIEAKLATMISIIVSVFVICNSFEGIVFILSSQEILNLAIIQEYLRPLADLLLVLNSSINVVIYCIFKREFREAFIQFYFQCNSKQKIQQQVLPAPVEMSKIPMIRAQLPKTSVEQTYASKDSDQETKFVPHPVLDSIYEEDSIIPDSKDDQQAMVSGSESGYDSLIKENAPYVKEGCSLEEETTLDSSVAKRNPEDQGSSQAENKNVPKSSNYQVNHVSEEDPIFIDNIESIASKIVTDILQSVIEDVPKSKMK